MFVEVYKTPSQTLTSLVRVSGMVNTAISALNTEVKGIEFYRFFNRRGLLLSVDGACVFKTKRI